MRIEITKYGVFTFVLSSAFLPYMALAQVAITEVMYDAMGSDSGREWVEVYNGGSVPVPLTAWKLFEANTNHKITAVTDNSVLAPGAYAIIASNPASFKKDWPQFTGQLFKSSFRLSNDGEALMLRNASSTDIDTLVYGSVNGGAGDGNTLNRASAGASVVARSPSPGAPMSASALVSVPSFAPVKVPVEKAPKAKKPASQKIAAAESHPPESNEIDTLPEVAEEEIQSTSLQVAAAGSLPNSTLPWWLGAIALAAFTVGCIFFAQRYARDEWDIIEESDPSV